MHCATASCSSDASVRIPNGSNSTETRSRPTSDLATNEVYRNAQGEKTETTQWHNVIAWGQLAEIMTRYLSKGSEVAIEGRLVYRQYEDKAGQQRVAAEIVTQEMLMLDRVPQEA